MASRASVPPASFGSSSRKPSSSMSCRNATTCGCGRITSATSSSASPLSDVTLLGAGEGVVVVPLLLAEPFRQLVFEPPGGLHPRHDRLHAQRITEDPFVL